jgi:hypothetical protein
VCVCDCWRFRRVIVIAIREGKGKREKRKKRPCFIYARHLLADGTKPTDPLEKKPVRLIISISYVRLWVRGKDFSFFGSSTLPYFGHIGKHNCTF